MGWVYYQQSEFRCRENALVEQLRAELRVAMADADGWKQARDDYVTRCHDLEQAIAERAGAS